MAKIYVDLVILNMIIKNSYFQTYILDDKHTDNAIKVLYQTVNAFSFTFKQASYRLDQS